MATRLSVCLCCSIVAHLACGSDAFAQAPVRKIRQKMTDTFNNTPDFMCSVNIERTARTGKEAPSTLQPLHVNAGIVNGKEMYALPSTDDDQAILRKVLSVYSRAGTGTFAMFARAVFLTSDATFYDGPEESKDGRTLARLDFAMPREVSHLSLNNLLHAVQVGYSGSIWTDPRNLEVARMLLRADGIPPDLGIKAVTQTIEYGRAPILGMSTLLPLATDLTVQETSGQELRITGRFRDCHQYASKRGEQFVENRPGTMVPVSAESLAPSPATAVAATPHAARVHALPPIEELVPAKTPFEMILDDAIDERTTTEGSKLLFTVSQYVKKNGEVVLPKGAKATGHVTRILRQEFIPFNSPRTYYVVGIQLDTIEVRGRRFQLWANLERVGPPATQLCFVPLSHSPDKWGPFDEFYTMFLIPNPESDESFLGVVYEFLRLGSNWRTYWTVVKAPK
jgi:hypothetical protein